TDVDLWVLEPDGTKCFYGNKKTKGGGHLFNDNTKGSGPEEYRIAKGPAGEYTLKVNLFSRLSAPAGPTQVTVVVTRNPGTPQETTQRFTATLTNRGDTIEVCKVRF